MAALYPRPEGRGLTAVDDKKNGELIILLRGTDTIDEWTDNAKDQISFPTKLIEWYESKIDGWDKKYANLGKVTIVGGHSKGGGNTLVTFPDRKDLFRYTENAFIPLTYYEQADLNGTKTWNVALVGECASTLADKDLFLYIADGGKNPVKGHKSVRFDEVGANKLTWSEIQERRKIYNPLQGIRKSNLGFKTQAESYAYERLITKQAVKAVLSLGKPYPSIAGSKAINLHEFAKKLLKKGYMENCGALKNTKIVEGILASTIEKVNAKSGTPDDHKKALQKVLDCVLKTDKAGLLDELSKLPLSPEDKDGIQKHQTLVEMGEKKEEYEKANEAVQKIENELIEASKTKNIEMARAMFNALGKAFESIDKQHQQNREEIRQLKETEKQKQMARDDSRVSTIKIHFQPPQELVQEEKLDWQERFDGLKRIQRRCDREYKIIKNATQSLRRYLVEGKELQEDQKKAIKDYQKIMKRSQLIGDIIMIAASVATAAAPFAQAMSMGKAMLSSGGTSLGTIGLNRLINKFTNSSKKKVDDLSKASDYNAQAQNLAALRAQQRTSAFMQMINIFLNNSEVLSGKELLTHLTKALDVITDARKDKEDQLKDYKEQRDKYFKKYMKKLKKKHWQAWNKYSELCKTLKEEIEDIVEDEEDIEKQKDHYSRRLPVALQDCTKKYLDRWMNGPKPSEKNRMLEGQIRKDGNTVRQFIHDQHSHVRGALQAGGTVATELTSLLGAVLKKPEIAENGAILAQAGVQGLKIVEMIHFWDFNLDRLKQIQKSIDDGIFDDISDILKNDDGTESVGDPLEIGEDYKSMADVLLSRAGWDEFITPAISLVAQALVVANLIRRLCFKQPNQTKIITDAIDRAVDHLQKVMEFHFLNILGQFDQLSDLNKQLHAEVIWKIESVRQDLGIYMIDLSREIEWTRRRISDEIRTEGANRAKGNEDKEIGQFLEQEKILYLACKNHMIRCEHKTGFDKDYKEFNTKIESYLASMQAKWKTAQRAGASHFIYEVPKNWSEDDEKQKLLVSPEQMPGKPDSFTTLIATRLSGDKKCIVPRASVFVETLGKFLKHAKKLAAMKTFSHVDEVNKENLKKQIQKLYTQGIALSQFDKHYLETAITGALEKRDAIIVPMKKAMENARVQRSEALALKLVQAWNNLRPPPSIIAINEQTKISPLAAKKGLLNRIVKCSSLLGDTKMNLNEWDNAIKRQGFAYFSFKRSLNTVKDAHDITPVVGPIFSVPTAIYEAAVGFTFGIITRGLKSLINIGISSQYRALEAHLINDVFLSATHAAQVTSLNYNSNQMRSLKNNIKYDYRWGIEASSRYDIKRKKFVSKVDYFQKVKNRDKHDARFPIKTVGSNTTHSQSQKLLEVNANIDFETGACSTTFTENSVLQAGDIQKITEKHTWSDDDRKLYSTGWKSLWDWHTERVRTCIESGEVSTDNYVVVPPKNSGDIPLIFPRSLIDVLHERMEPFTTQMMASGYGTLIPTYSFTKNEVSKRYELKMHFTSSAIDKNESNEYAAQTHTVATVDQETVLGCGYTDDQTVRDGSHTLTQKTLDPNLFLLRFMYTDNEAVTFSFPGEGTYVKEVPFSPTPLVVPEGKQFEGLYHFLDNYPRYVLHYDHKLNDGSINPIITVDFFDKNVGMMKCPDLHPHYDEGFSSLYTALKEHYRSSEKEAALNEYHAAYHVLFTLCLWSSAISWNELEERVLSDLRLPHPDDLMSNLYKAFEWEGKRGKDSGELLRKSGLEAKYSAIREFQQSLKKAPEEEKEKWDKVIKDLQSSGVLPKEDKKWSTFLQLFQSMGVLSKEDCEDNVDLAPLLFEIMTATPTTPQSTFENPEVEDRARFTKLLSLRGNRRKKRELHKEMKELTSLGKALFPEIQFTKPIFSKSKSKVDISMPYLSGQIRGPYQSRLSRHISPSREKSLKSSVKRPSPKPAIPAEAPAETELSGHSGKTSSPPGNIDGNTRKKGSDSTKPTSDSPGKNPSAGIAAPKPVSTLKTFTIGNKQYTPQWTEGDGSCGIHALLGKKNSTGKFIYGEGTSKGPRVAAKNKFFNELKRRLDQEDKKIEDKFIQALEDRLSRCSGKNPSTVDLGIFYESFLKGKDGWKVQRDKLFEEQIILKNGRAEAFWKCLTELDDKSTYFKILEDFKPEEWKNIDFTKPEETHNKKAIDAIKACWEELLEAMPDSIKENFKTANDALKAKKGEIDGFYPKVIKESLQSIWSIYKDKMMGISYFLTNSEMEIAAILFNKKLLLAHADDSGEITGEFRYNMSESDKPDVVVLHEGIHYSRCEKPAEPKKT